MNRTIIVTNRMQHTEVPHELDNLQERLSKTEDDIKNHPERILQPGDKVVYAAIRSFMDETRTCYPSFTKIKERAKCGQAKIVSAIDRLIQAGFMKLSHKRLDNGKTSNLYIFPKTEFDENFEMFTIDFLMMDIPINVKEYYMDIQKYMYGKDTGVGKIGYTNAKLAELTGINAHSIKKYNDYLISKGLLAEEASGNYDSAGFQIMQKNFQLDGFQQAALWVKAVTQQIQINTEDISNVKDELAEVKQELKLAKEEIKELKRQKALENVKDVEYYPESYKM